MKKLRVISPAPRDVWHHLMQTDPEALPYQSPQWLDAICAAGHYHDASRLYESGDGVQILVPLVRSKGLTPALSTLASMPNAWGMGGFLSSGRIRKQDIEEIFADLSRLPHLRINLRPNPRQGELWAAAKPAGVLAIPRFAHVLDLQGGFDHVWNHAFDKKTRTRIRKAERSGVVIERDSTGRLIPVFYELYLRSLDRWSGQQHEPRWLTHLRGRNRDSLHKFQTIAKHLGDACAVWVAWVNGQPAAADLVLQFGNVNDSRGAMDKELAAPTGANDLLMKHMIESACRAGCRYYHLGESGRSASLAHFKSRFGAVGYAYEEYYLEKLPITKIDGHFRGFVKRIIGFKD